MRATLTNIEEQAYFVQIVDGFTSATLPLPDGCTLFFSGWAAAVETCQPSAEQVGHLSRLRSSESWVYSEASNV